MLTDSGDLVVFERKLDEEDEVTTFAGETGVTASDSDLPNLETFSSKSFIIGLEFKDGDDVEKR